MGLSCNFSSNGMCSMLAAKASSISYADRKRLAVCERSLVDIAAAFSVIAERFRSGRARRIMSAAARRRRRGRQKIRTGPRALGIGPPQAAWRGAVERPSGGPSAPGRRCWRLGRNASVAFFKLGAHSATLRPEFGGPKSLRCCCAKGAGRGRARQADSSFWRSDLSMVHAFYVYQSCFMTRHAVVGAGGAVS